MDEQNEATSVTPPKYSLVKAFETIRKKGIVGGLEDTEQGPHVHLTLLLIAVVVVSLGIILITSII